MRKVVAGLRRSFVGVVGLMLVFATGAQAAEPTAGATYTGQLWESVNVADGSHLGEYGGTVSFDVSADGTQVTRFEVTDAEVRHPLGGPDVCTPTMDAVTTSPVPIVVPPGYEADYYQFYRDSDADDINFLDGIFPRPNEAAGRVSVHQNQGSASCWTGTTYPGNIYFTATTGGGCTGSQQYLDAQAAVAKLTAAVAALEPKVTAASEALAKANKKLEKAKAKLANAEGKKAKAKARKAVKNKAAKALEAKHLFNKLSKRLVKKRAALKAANINFAEVCA